MNKTNALNKTEERKTINLLIIDTDQYYLEESLFPDYLDVPLISVADDKINGRGLVISVHQLTLQPIMTAKGLVGLRLISLLSRFVITIDLSPSDQARKAGLSYDLSCHIGGQLMIKKSRYGARGARKVSTGCKTCK
jgi:hypothetical protein